MHQRFTFFVTILFLAGLSSCHSSPDVPQAEKGFLDLRDWSWENGEIAFNGEWDFYWQELIPPQSFSKGLSSDSIYTHVPSPWFHAPSQHLFSPDTGYATYHLKIHLPPDSVPLSLRINTVATAMNIWVNEDPVYQVGKVSTSAQQAISGINPDVVSIPYSPVLDIVAHISNYHYRKGGIWEPFTISTSETILRSWIREHATTFFLVGSFIIMALYHIILYLHRRSDKSSLYFSIFCLLIVLRTLSTDLYLIADILPYEWAVRTEFFSFYFCIPVFGAFLYAVYPTILPCDIVRYSFYIAAAFSAAVFTLSTLWSTYTVIPYEIFTVVASIYVFYRLIGTAQWHRLDGIAIFSLGFLCLFIALLNDLLYANYLIDTFFIAPFGLFLFLFFQSALLSRRFSRAANDLEYTNAQLEQRNHQVQERNDALNKLNQEMDVFVYRTSHDLRAPLTSLLGIIALMRNESISTEIISYLDLQERSINKLDSFIKEILDYSRNSRLAIEPQIIEFGELIEETYALYTHLPQFNRIDKQTIVSQTAPYGGDKKRMEVIFNNLLSNALRYYNPYKENPYVRIEVTIDEAQAIIEIKDNGLGIAPEHQERIFEMFYRASTKSEGSGLGLFLVKETIEKIGGNVKIQSEVNKGTLFTVHLPNQAMMDEVAAE